MYGFFFGKKIISPAEILGSLYSSNSPNKRATHFWQCGLCWKLSLKRATENITG